MKISIVTYNTFGVNILSNKFFLKCEKIAQVLRDKNIDIINFQEVVFYKHLNFLKKHLPEHKYIIYKPSFFGPQAGLVTFSRLPLQFTEFKKFSKNGDFYNISIIHKLAQRGLLVSTYSDDLKIINTHFSANMSNKWDKENNYTKVLNLQVNDLHEMLDLYNNTNFLISGDFNIPKSTSLYTTLGKNNIIDVFKDIHKKTHLGDFMINTSLELQVDYIFIKKNKQSKLDIIDKSYIFDKKVKLGPTSDYLSDHFGLEVSVDLSFPS